MNEPYYRVKRDSVWDGAATGALVGGVAVSGAQFAAARVRRSQLSDYRRRMRGIEDIRDRELLRAASMAQRGDTLGAVTHATGAANMSETAMNALRKDVRANNMYGKFFGTRQRRLATYAAGVLGMGLAGAAIDRMN